MTTDAAPGARPTTDVDRIANDYLDALVELSPITATAMGIAGHDEDLDDFSPAGNGSFKTKPEGKISYERSSN